MDGHLIVEVDRPDEESCLHHEVAVVELDIRVQRVVVLDHAKLFDPLRSAPHKPHTHTGTHTCMRREFGKQQSRMAYARVE